MLGEAKLNTLLATMHPSLSDDEYVFLTGARESPATQGVRPILTFREKEGETWIVTDREAAQLDCEGAFRSRLITLNVHSSLEAVGFLARIATELAKAGISVNAVSAFYHDHLFVPADRAEEALNVLRALSERAQAQREDA
jgi:uncharacterized protein